VGLIDAEFRKRILAARAAFARALPERLRRSVQFFEPAGYNAAASIRDNLLFGKLAVDKPAEAARINALMAEVITEAGLRPAVISLGLDYHAGVGAARLTAQQRQKLAIARCLLKRPDLLILNDALAALEPAVQNRVFARVRTTMQGRSLLLLEPGDARARDFQHVFSLENGKIVERRHSSGPALSPAAGAASAAAAHEGDMDIYRLVSILTRIPLFTGIDRSRLKLLAFTSEIAAYEQGEVLFRQGEAGDKAYVIIEGKAEVVLEHADGERVVAELEDHQLFGEMALLSSLPRATTIRAATRLSVLVLSHEVFTRLIEDNPAIAISMNRILAERLATTLRDFSREKQKAAA
jgi:putative ABC transport system ATP-binding protein